MMKEHLWLVSGMVITFAMMLEVQLLKERLIAIFQVCNFFEKLTTSKEEKSNLYPQTDWLRGEMPRFGAEVLDLSHVVLAGLFARQCLTVKEQLIPYDKQFILQTKRRVRNGTARTQF